MGAEVTYWVRIAMTVHEWIDVSAVTAQEAEDKASRMRGVVSVLEVRDSRSVDEQSVVDDAGNTGWQIK